MKKIIFTIFILFVFTLCNLYSLSLQLKRVATINDETIRVYDLIESWEGEPADLLKIQNILVAELPYQRRMMNIPSNTVARKIRLQYPDIELSIPSIITAVRWEDVILGENRIKLEAESYLRDYFTLSNNAEISFNNLPRINIPSDLVELSFEMSRTTENTNYIRLDGRAILNGQTINVFNVLARVQDQQFVYQANKTIRKGQKISSNDFEKVMVAVNLNNSFLAEIDENDDIIANNLISRGSYLRTTDVVNAPYVERNGLVSVLIRGTSMQLNYEAISRADGWLGDRIMLQNPDSRQTFYAVVVDKNKVLISLED
ncbi:MAG: flagellar basal body P-ring formation chaperone FlgA [Candidatus Cloacimonetes bacterium]|nr:flagellar basal body P-ring formation chaperone FlgA [Candidatus Cloacimonadota bacterium]